MALDEAILEAIEKDASPPTLRLYAWEPACLSLGYAQRVGDVDLDRLQSFGWELVRRPTGGRAILHIDELTYSVVGPASDPRLAGSVLESYHNLSEALLNALHLLMIPAEALPKAGQPTSGNRPTPANQNPVCFEVPSHYEITSSGKKLIGSAQARRKEGVLQHGSLPLTGDLTRITQALAFSSDAERARAAQRLSNRATTAEIVLGQPLAWGTAAQAFAQAFAETLNIEFSHELPVQTELDRANQLVEEKYANPDWTQRT